MRIVGDNVENKIVPIEEARETARKMGFDLVEINSQGDPPVCKVIDFGKFLYEQKKKEKEQKQKAAKTELKEIRFGPNTSDHDFQFKAKHGRQFLEEGNKFKAYVHFKGRTIVHKERGEYLLLKLAQELEDVGKVEQMPKLEGKRMTLFMSPKSSKK